MEINTETLLYHYLQKDLHEKDVWLFQMLTAKLIAALGIWFHPEAYAKLPVLVPYAIRDPSCRKSNNKMEEQWGAPNKFGFFRDDNSLIKNVPRSLKVQSPLRDLYDGRTLGTGFVAFHVWRLIKTEEFENDKQWSTRHPLLNSFVPNLVWLPAMVARLSDLEGSFVQLYLQALSMKIYRHQTVEARIAPVVETCWAALEQPNGIPESGLPDLSDLNFFTHTSSFFDTRRKAISSVIEAIDEILQGGKPSRKVVSSRYGEGLPQVDKSALIKLKNLIQPLIEGGYGA